MNALTRKLATAGSALVMAASGLLLASSPASAATSCHGSSCSGLDPSTTVCQNDARTVSTSAWGVELRYSPTCRSAWARKGPGDSLVKTIWIQSTLGERRDADYNGRNTYTAMVNDKDVLSFACEMRADTTSRCTDSF